MTIAALFVRADSVYKTLPGVDAYDAERNALSFDFSRRVVAHPPCRLWSRLRAFSTAPESERELAFFAIKAVRRCGGVLEHPAASSLWAAAGLPLPGGAVDAYGGYSVVVDQYWWGHRACKRTWLYIVGCLQVNLPDYPIVLGDAQFVVSTSVRGGKREISKAEREATPVEFARWLCLIAEGK